MFSKRWKWELRSGRHQRVFVRVIGKTGSVTANAIIDTGSGISIFNKETFKELFKGDNASDTFEIHGIGVTRGVSRRVSLEIFSTNGELIRKITNVEADFIMDDRFQESVLGISNVLDQFKLVLDYPAGEMVVFG